MTSDADSALSLSYTTDYADLSIRSQGRSGQGHAGRASARRAWPPRRSSSAAAASTSSRWRRPTAAQRRTAAQHAASRFGPALKDVQNFTSQLAVMIRAGISIRAAIEGIAEQIENPKFKEMLVPDQEGRGGRQAVLRRPGALSQDLQPAVHQHGEGLGAVRRLRPSMLDRIAGYLDQQIETRSKVRGAMIYPGIIGIMAVGTTIFLLTFVLPRFMVDLRGQGSGAARCRPRCCWRCPTSWSTTGTSCCSRRSPAVWGFVADAHAPTGAGSGGTRSSSPCRSSRRCSAPSTSAARCTRWAS